MNRTQPTGIVRVALDVPLDRLFDYVNSQSAGVGDRVVVPFGRKHCVGVVVEVADTATVSAERLRSVERVLRDCAPLPPDWIEFCRFTADYYQRPLGEVIHAALPPRLRRREPMAADARYLEIAPGGDLQIPRVCGHGLAASEPRRQRRVDDFPERTLIVIGGESAELDPVRRQRRAIPQNPFHRSQALRGDRGCVRDLHHHADAVLASEGHDNPITDPG